MGILRTNEISGLETPTPVTGSVYFDGSGDYLDIGAFHISDSWTMEFWFNTSVNNTTQRPMNFSSNLGGTNYAYIELTSGGKIKARVASAAAFGETPAVTTNEWHHTALSYDGSTAYFVYDGKLIATQSVSYSNNSIQVRFGADESNASSNLFTGYVSNARILSGIALYTSDFTPPVHELQPIGDTVLLCCNNPDSAGAEATGKTITINGNAAASTFSPGLTRDFTYGTQFEGVAKFDTQGYFVPPSGTTEQRGRGRGVFGGGYTSVGVNTLDYVNIQSQGNAIDFGDLNNSVDIPSPCSSLTRGLFAGGATVFSPTVNAINNIDYITIASTGNAVDFGDLRESRRFASGGVSNNTRGVWGGGYTPTLTLQMDYVTIASTGTALDFGTTVPNPFFIQGLSSPTRGVWGGGYAGGQTSIIRFITIATTGTISSFGDLTVARHAGTATSSSIRGLFAGGRTGPTLLNTIDYITIASTGNAQDFGDLISARRRVGACSNSTRGLFGGGYNPNFNLIDFVNIASTGDAVDFGDLTSARRTLSGCSDSHGGLS